MQHKSIIASIFFACAGPISVAQGNMPPPPAPPPPPGLPIDHGLVVLFVIALVYGIYKINKMAKRPA